MQTETLILWTYSLYLACFGAFLLLRNKANGQLLSIGSTIVNLIGLLSFIFFYQSQTEDLAYEWLGFQENSFSISFRFDNLSIMMFGLVQFVSLAVQTFSTAYMKKEPRIADYYAFLNLFVFSMLGLVLAGNLLQVFVFWELVGFSSYLLIGFWYQKKSASAASMKAFLVNRVGDAGFLIALGLIYKNYGTFELAALKNIDFSTVSPWIGMGLLAGVMGKSAQFPLQIWLPDAMEGPTPVSALIHAATMVVAGIFLMASVDFLLSQQMLDVIAFIGTFTALIAAISAIFQFDIKKLLAYSTISHLGLMLTAIGFGSSGIALFHLFTHAFFKAGLFLIAGAAISYYHHEQDMRKMGDLFSQKPLLGLMYIICGAALVGLPFTSGFYSKDSILLLVWNAHQDGYHYLLATLISVAAVMTSFYIGKQFLMVFVSKKSKVKWSFPDTYEWSIMPLALGSLWFLQNLNPFGLQHLQFANYFYLPIFQEHSAAYLVSMLSVFCLIITQLLFRKGFFNQNGKLQTFAQDHFGLDLLYTGVIVPFVKKCSTILYQLDRKIIDGAVSLIQRITLFVSQMSSWADIHLVDGLVKSISETTNIGGSYFSRIQNGKIQSYIIGVFLMVAALFLFLILITSV